SLTDSAPRAALAESVRIRRPVRDLPALPIRRTGIFGTFPWASFLKAEEGPAHGRALAKRSASRILGSRETVRKVQSRRERRSRLDIRIQPVGATVLLRTE